MANAVAKGLTESETKAWDRLYYLTAIAGYAKQSINLMVSSTPMQLRALPPGSAVRERIMDEVAVLIKMLEQGLREGKYPTEAADLDGEVLQLTSCELEFKKHNS